ncbi:MAG: hypothetical protein WCL18_01380 [bacterium]
MTKNTKKAFGMEFVHTEGNYTPIGDTWRELAKSISNPTGTCVGRGNEISIEKELNGHREVIQVRLIGFQYPNGDTKKTPQAAFLKTRQGQKQVITL